MANKKYNEFDPGTYDTAKIFLQADDTTGALEKVNLPVIPGESKYSIVGRDMSNNTNPVTTETTLQTLTLLANSLATNGDQCICRSVYTTLNAGTAKTVRFKFGGTTLITSTGTQADRWLIDVVLTRLSASTMSSEAVIYRNGNIAFVQYGVVTSLDFTTNNAIIMTGASGTASIITGVYLSVDLIKQ